MSSALATLTAIREAGLALTVEGRGLRCRPTPTPELLARLRAHKAELLDLLVGDHCRCCGAQPTAVEVGGFDLGGWRCEACLAAGGLPWRAEPEPLPELPCLKMAPLGTCRRCRFIAPLAASGVCGQCLWRYPADAQAPARPASCQERVAISAPKLLTSVLKRLARKYPDGVEEAMLKSWFVYELASERERVGLPKLNPRQNTELFEQTLREIED